MKTKLLHEKCELLSSDYLKKILDFRSDIALWVIATERFIKNYP